MQAMMRAFHKACVTGGAGFIGTHLVRALLGRGLAVTVLDNLHVGTAANVPLGARLIEGDILNLQHAKAAMEGCDIVFHLAARVAIRSSFAFMVEDTTVNVVGTTTVLQAARQVKTVRKFITASSMAVYADAPAPVPINESHPTVPLSPYGISKLAAEQLTHVVCAEAGLQSVVLRLFNTYGPGQALSPYVGVVTIFVNALHQGKPPTIYGDGEQCRDFVHVEDVVAGFLCAMDADIGGETFNIGSGMPTSVNTVWHSINRAMHMTCRPQHADPVQGELRYSIANISKARTLLGYTPAHRFETSIAAVVADIRSTSA